MDVLRTPDHRFADLPGWAFDPRYAEVPALDGSGATLRMHYVEEGPAGGVPVVLLHGEPSWGYLYRKMIGPLADAGLRVVVPDLIGFGRSDKPAARSDYTYARHVGWVRHLLFEHLGLPPAVLFGQDWGGLVGLRLVGEEPDRWAGVVAANTFLPTGDRPAGEAFMAWRTFSQETEVFPVGRIVNGGCATDLPDEVVAAYDAPFPDESYKEGARQFPVLVPIRPDQEGAEENRQAWKGLEGFDRPFLCAFSDRDPITAGADRVLRERIPGAAAQDHVTIEGGGHFLQEDCGERLAAVVRDFVLGRIRG